MALQLPGRGPLMYSDTYLIPARSHGTTGNGLSEPVSSSVKQNTTTLQRAEVKRGCHSFIHSASVYCATLSWVMGRPWRVEEANSLPAGALVLRRKTQEDA